MDKEQSEQQHACPEINEFGENKNQSRSSFKSSSKQEQQNRVVRRPGRPPLMFKNKANRISKNNELDNQNDEDFNVERSKIKQRGQYSKEQKQNNLQGFIKIIDYLKRIQCDETSLHNKMNPYNLLTPTCFWYMISTEYFSFDFFHNKNPQEVALQFLRRAQKTTIILPLRFVKPQKLQAQLQFQTKQLKQFSTPITQRLTTLTNIISTPVLVNSQIVEKSGYITSIAQDNQFRSSTRAIVFNWLKKKITNSDKWGSIIKSKLQGTSKIPPKQFTTRIYQCQKQVKHQQLEAAPQIFGRQRRNKNNLNNTKKTKPIKKPIGRQKKIQKKMVEDQIYDESQSNQNKSQNQQKGQNSQMIQQNQDQQVQIKQQKIEQNQKQEIQKQPVKEQIIHQIKDQDIQHSDQQFDDERNSQRQYITFSKTYDLDDALLESILHMPLDNIISILKASIQTPKLPSLTRPFMPPPKNDPLQLVYQIHPDEEIFLDYMKERQQRIYKQKSYHNDQIIQEKEREVQAEDAKCQVCTDGDYTEDNLIVFCSMCNISLHQRCVGLAKVPADNWVCEVCASFGPSGINVPCPLCHVKGGALKRTSIHINTPLFKETNPQYHQFAKKCPNYKHKQQYIPLSRGIGKVEEQPYYDYFAKATYPNDQPICHYVWVHYVCAIWVPQCYFQQKNGLINIKGLENIDKKRFKQRCLVCKQVKAGACVKCQNENCNKFYHPECARKKKIYMQQLNLDKLKYLIFCQAHQPIKVKRKIQVKKKKQRDEIVKFCRGIQKYVQTYKIANLPFKLLKVGFNVAPQINKLDSKKDKGQVGDQKIMIKVDKNTDQDFIKSVIQGLVKQNQIVVNLSCLGNDRYKIDDIIKPSKRDMRKSLTRQEQFWKNYKNSEAPQANLKRFNTIIRQNNFLKQKLQNFINYGSNLQENLNKQDKKVSKRLGRRRKQRIQTVIEQQGAIFCVCRKPYNGQNDMFQCQVCNQWYHYDCIGFMGSQQDAQKLDFHCMKCLKYQSPESKRQILQKCSKYFSQDSLFLNYRPPTPSLQSQDEQVKYSSNYKNQSQKKKQIYQIKHNLQIQRLEIQKPSKSKAQLKNIYNDFINIPDEKINLEIPFIIYDPTQGSQKLQDYEYIQQQESPHFKQAENNHINQQQKMQQSNKNVNQVDSNVQNTVENGLQQLSFRKKDLSIESIQFQSQSSQKTPQFRRSSNSESFENEKHLKHQRGYYQKIKTSIIDPEIQQQGDEIDQQSQNHNPNSFHFNREQIQKLKHQIEQQEKLQSQKTNKQEFIEK